MARRVTKPPVIPAQLNSGKGTDRLSAAIHLDLDGGTHIFRVHGWRHETDDDPLFETGLRQALDFFDSAKMAATLFVIAEDLKNPRKRELIKEAVRRGHEIASHSLTHRKLTTLDRSAKRREIFESRERIATQLGVQVRGFRAPAFDIDRESLELVGAAGYTYDSSLFPNNRSAHKVGVPELSVIPHGSLNSHSLIELPLPLHTPLPLPFHPCYSLVFGTWYFRAGLRAFRRRRAPLVLLFHLTDFADPLPDELLHGWKSKFFTLSYMSSEHKRERCEHMLELVQREYNVIDTTSLLAMYAKAPANGIGIGHSL
jgi:peptidoglycan/xylan/chitin deacetylase (PgdA/CDA1 family)